MIQCDDCGNWYCKCEGECPYCLSKEAADEEPDDRSDNTPGSET